jgi:aminopeptidase N
MRRSVLILFTLITTCFANAQELPDFLRLEKFESKGTAINSYEGYKGNNEALLTKTSGRPYDVLSYDLYMNWINPLSYEHTDTNNTPIILASDRVFTGTNMICFSSDVDNLSSIDLDAVNLVIKSVRIPGGQSLTYNNSGTVLTVNLPAVLNKGDKDTIVVSYVFQSSINQGFYLYPKKMFIGINPGPDTVFVEERLAYTMSEPQDARLWMPCNDSPDDKAYSTLHVEVPKGFTAVSNGLLYKVDQTDSSTIYNWHEKYPIATYLMAATASKFKEFSHWYHRITNPQDSVEIQYYVWEKDYNATKTNATEYNAHNAFRNTAEMIRYFSSLFVEYPYEKYGMVAPYRRSQRA